MCALHNPYAILEGLKEPEDDGHKMEASKKKPD